jgi:AraC family transcriptional regulator, transcriptional activator of pobA
VLICLFRSEQFFESSMGRVKSLRVPDAEAPIIRQGFANAPHVLRFKYPERAAFGFFHIEPLPPKSISKSRRSSAYQRLDYDQISILFDGYCSFVHDGQPETAKGPSFVYTPANVVHHLSYSPGARGVLVSVSPDFVAGLPSLKGSASTAMIRLANRRVVALRSDTQVTTIRHLVDLLLEKDETHHHYRLDALRYLFGALLLEFDRALENETGGQPRTRIAADDAALFRKFRDLVQCIICAVGFTSDNPPDRLCTVEGFSRQLSVTRYTLNAVCESVSGNSARETVNLAILDQATRLLLYTTKPVKEISYLLGYSHASHFARFFKQRRGSTPESFRISTGTRAMLKPFAIRS